MIQNILAGLFILSSSINAPSCTVGLIADLDHQPIYTIAENKKEDNDPGKDITDDPHGPGTHGPNPHGRDPYDEIHDRNLPANDPDKYLRRDD